MVAAEVGNPNGCHAWCQPPSNLRIALPWRPKGLDPVVNDDLAFIAQIKGVVASAKVDFIRQVHSPHAELLARRGGDRIVRRQPSVGNQLNRTTNRISAADNHVRSCALTLVGRSKGNRRWTAHLTLRSHCKRHQRHERQHSGNRRHGHRGPCTTRNRPRPHAATIPCQYLTFGRGGLQLRHRSLAGKGSVGWR